jgi:methylated-DNA-[protein]-cysteine S-methyltransferase
MTELAEKTYELLKTVPRGRVTTYKSLAEALGTRGYRAIGQFMKKNPYAPKVPCHRVVAASGAIGGYAGGIPKKIQMLQAEGVQVKNNMIVDFPRVYYMVR